MRPPGHPLLPCSLLLGVICSLSASAPAATTNSTFFARVWQSDEGLPNNNVNGLAKTADGYLWVATPMGLARFDGTRFDEVSSTNFIGAPNRGVMALLSGREGTLWVQMDRGAILGLNPTNVQVFTARDGAPDLLAQTLVEDDEGRIWITYLGGVLCYLKDGVVTSLNPAPPVEDGSSSKLLDNAKALTGLLPGPVSSVAKDTQGRLWIARGGQVGIFRNGTFQSQLQLDRNWSRIASARAGGIWICNGTRLSHLDEGGLQEIVGEFRADRSGVQPSVILEDRRGAVWVGTTFGGLFRYWEGRFEKVQTSHPEIVSLLEDNEDNLWVGTRGGGLNRLRQRAVRLEGVDAGLPFEAVQSLCQDTSNVLWATTVNGVLVRQVSNVWSTVSTQSNWPGGVASCVAADPRGGVWIGTRNHRLIRWDAGRFVSWGKSRGVEASPVLTLLVSSKGDLWMGGQNRTVQCFRDGQFRTLTTPEDTRLIRASAEDASGNIWFGSSQGMLFRAGENELIDETERIATAAKPIRSLYATSDGSLWIGFAECGLGRLKDGRFTLIDTQRGLFDNYISQIVADNRGWLWLGADHGIFKINQEEVDAVAEHKAARIRSVHYGRSEGLLNLQADFGYAPGAICSRDGRVWIPMRSGLAVVESDRLGESLEAPPVLLKRVAVDEREVAVYGGILPTQKGGDLGDLDNARTVLRLRPGHRKLEFEFAALSFAAPENVRFQYQLEGFDERWIEGTQRSAAYSRLAAGNYRFRVKACNGNGIWSETGPTLALVVAPFFWQTWWFQITALASFSSIVIVVVRYASFRRLRLRLRLLEQQAALDRERTRIARDLHDDLGSRLTKIVLLSDLLLDYRAEPDKAGENARQISSTARQVMKALDETVWAVNPRNDTLPDLINYIGQFAVEFLRTAGIRCHVDLPERPADHVVSAEVRHNLFLVVKEALNNVVRHASATEVWLRVSVAENSLRLTIEDNGHGFEQPTNGDGADGLRNMRNRVEELGGRFNVEGRSAPGTRISVVVPSNGKGT